MIAALFLLLALFTPIQQRDPSLPPTSGESIWIVPNPIKVCDGSGLGQGTVYWLTSAAVTCDVRVGSADGPIFYNGTHDSGPGTASSPVGGVQTGRWVTEGTTFYLIGTTRGYPQVVLGTTVAHLTTAGCTGPTPTPTPRPTPVPTPTPKMCPCKGQ